MESRGTMLMTTGFGERRSYVRYHTEVRGLHRLFFPRLLLLALSHVKFFKLVVYLL